METATLRDHAQQLATNNPALGRRRRSYHCRRIIETTLSASVA